MEGRLDGRRLDGWVYLDGGQVLGKTTLANFYGHKTEFRNFLKIHKVALTDIRIKITNLEEEIKMENKELSIDFDSNSNVIPSSASRSSSMDKSSETLEKIEIHLPR